MMMMMILCMFCLLLVFNGMGWAMHYCLQWQLCWSGMNTSIEMHWVTSAAHPIPSQLLSVATTIFRPSHPIPVQHVCECPFSIVLFLCINKLTNDRLCLPIWWLFVHVMLLIISSQKWGGWSQSALLWMSSSWAGLSLPLAAGYISLFSSLFLFVPL